MSSDYYDSLAREIADAGATEDWRGWAMSKPCDASIRIGCPDAQTVLVCHRPDHDPDWDHYDGQERLWWQAATTEPPLYTGRRPEPHAPDTPADSGHIAPSLRRR